MGSTTLTVSKPVRTQTKALIHESRRFLRVLAACSSKGGRAVCPMIEEAILGLLQALIQPKLVQHVGFTLHQGALIDELPLGITVLAFLVSESGGSCGPCQASHS